MTNSVHREGDVAKMKDRMSRWKYEQKNKLRKALMDVLDGFINPIGQMQKGFEIRYNLLRENNKKWKCLKPEPAFLSDQFENWVRTG